MEQNKEYRLTYTSRAEELVSRMTFEEKVQLIAGNCKVYESMGIGSYNSKPYGAGGCERLGVPEMKFCDGPRGCVCGNSTCFPVTMARGATFDPVLEERVSAVSWSQTIGSLGTVLPTFFIWLCIGIFGNGKKDTTDRGYFWSALLFAVIGAAFIIWSFFGIKEKIYIPPRKLSGTKCFKIIFTDRRMIVLLIASLFSGVINIGAMFLPYFANWNCIGILPMDKINAFLTGVLGKDPQLTAVSILPTILSVTSGIAYMLPMLLVPPLLKKMSKKTLWIAQSLIGGVMCLVTYFIGVYVLPYNTLPGFIVYAVLRFFTNFPVGMSIVLLVAMFADITDDLEMKTDERLEATAYSMKGLLYKISLAFRTSIFSMWHCPDNYIPGLAVIGDMGDFAAATVPRKLMMQCGTNDKLFPLEGSKQAMKTITRVYEINGCGERFTPDVFNGKHEVDLPAALEFFGRRETK